MNNCWNEPFIFICDQLLSERRSYDATTFARIVLQDIFGDYNVVAIGKSSVDMARWDLLLGPSSETFATVVRNGDLFDYTLSQLISALQWTRVPANVVEQSIGIHFLQSLLCACMPLDDGQMQLLFRKTSSVPKNRPRGPVRSAYGLLKSEVVASCYAPEMIVGGGFTSLHPRTTAFLEKFIVRVCEYHDTLFDAHVIALHCAFTHYIKFLTTVTGSNDLEAYKTRLIGTNTCFDDARGFFNRWFRCQALNGTFYRLVDFWSTLAFPPDSSNGNVVYSRLSNSVLDVFLVIARRCLSADLSVPEHASVVQSVVDAVVGEPWKVQILDSAGLQPLTFLEELSMQVESERIVLDRKSKNANRSWISNLMNEEDTNQTSLDALQLLATKLNRLLPLSPSIAQRSAEESSSSLNISQFCPRAASTPVLRRSHPPDHVVDENNVCRLTDLGRMQILTRKACFDYSAFAAPNASIRLFENPTLVQFFENLSSKYANSSFARYLIRERASSPLVALLAYFFIQESNPPLRAPATLSGGRVKGPEQRFTLRIFASYVTLAFLIFAIYCYLRFLLSLIF